jgi:hypothetical protein
LSDEILNHHENLRRIRVVLSALLDELEARSAFLIDEAGVPFAAVGNVEFRFPHPLPSSEGAEPDDTILKALLGMERTDESSPSLLFKVSPRALLVTIVEKPLQGRKRREALSRLEQAAGEIKSLLES